MKLSFMLRLGITVVAAALALAGASGQEKKPAAPAKKSETAAPAAQLGTKESAKWTDTTKAAAGTPEQKAVLDSGKPITVTGELVELSCYLQLGKRGEKHIDCGSKCLQNGMPAAVVTSSGRVYLILAEEHDPRRDGKADLRAVLIPLLSKQVRVTGMETTHEGYRAIFVSASEVSATK